MDRIEMVEKLREKAGVSYEEAKAALETANWDLLDAVVLLEKEGKVSDAGYSTKKEQADKEEKAKSKQEKQKSDGFEKFMGFLGRVIHKGNTNSLVILKDGERKFSLPVTALVLLLIFGFYVTLPLLIIGLFFSFHYRFEGPELGKEKINKAMAQASKAAEAVKDEFKEDTEDEVEDLKDEANDLKKKMKKDSKKTKKGLRQEVEDLIEELEEALEDLDGELEDEFGSSEEDEDK